MFTCTEKVQVYYSDKYRVEGSHLYRRTVHEFSYEYDEVEYVTTYHKGWKWLKKLHFAEAYPAKINPYAPKLMILDYLYPYYAWILLFGVYAVLYTLFEA